MGIDSRGGRDMGRDMGRGVGRGVGRGGGRDRDGGGKTGAVPSPLPYIGSKWSRTDFGS